MIQPPINLNKSRTLHTQDIQSKYLMVYPRKKPCTNEIEGSL